MKLTQFKNMKLLKTIIMVLIIVVVFSLLFKEISSIDFKKSIMLFRKMNTFTFVTLIIAGLLSLIPLILYDIVLTKALKLNVPLRTIIVRSYIINAVNNIVSLGGLVGSGLRHYTYKPYTESASQLNRVISLLLLSMYSGLSFLCLLFIFDSFNIESLHTRFVWLKYVIYFAGLFLIFFVIFTIAKPVAQKRFLGLSFTLVSIIEWLCVVLLFQYILIVLNIKLPFPALLGLFAVAALSGMISMIPGGFGAFDLVMLAGISSFGAAEEKVALALILYRTIYYFFPFLIALLLASFEFRDSAKTYFGENKIISSAAETGSFLKALQKESMTELPNVIPGLLCIITGLVYYFNHFLIVYDAIYSQYYTTYFFIIIIFNVSASLMLLICSKGVMRGTMRAMMMSIISIAILIVTVFLSYGTIISYIWLGILIVVIISRYRKARVVKQSLTPFKLLMSILLVFILLLINRFLTMDMLDLYPHVVTRFDTNIRGLLVWSAVLLYMLIGFSITIYYAVKYKNVFHSQMTTEQIQQLIETYGGNNLSHLAHTGDKLFFVHEAQDTFLMFHKTYNSLIVLGDPIGNEEHFYELLNNFYDKAEYYGYDIIFYQVQEHLMPLYHEFGNSFFKLGEEALIDLTSFTVSGKKQRSFRATLNKFEKELYTFEVLKAPYKQADFEQLQQISTHWLGDKQEMQFSVGSFDENYLNQAPIGIVRNHEGMIEAFCSFMPTYDGQTLSVDLIRWKDSEMPMMDILYLRMLLYAQAQGYRFFNMGMATLSNVGQNKHAYLREKIAGKAFENFNGLYSFKGLRQYKQKFNPDWQPRFLIYRKYNSLIWSLIRVALTINNKKQQES